MEDDIKLAETKALAGFELTSSTSMGGQLGKSQENGSRVSDEDKIDSSVNGVGNDDVDVPLKKLAEKYLRGVKGDEGSAVGHRIAVEGTGQGDGTAGDKSDGISVGSTLEGDGLARKAEFGNGRESLKSLARKKRLSSSEAGGQSSSDDKPIASTLSSISQRTRNRVVTGKKEEVEGTEKASEMSVEGCEEHGFPLGDFVWGKIKSHPWWPGRIYDPSDASEFASRYKHEGRLLVAYFGDGTFAWCDPSQLKPFVENFGEMSSQSNMKTFVNAVEEAAKEFGRLVELQSTCSCTRSERKSSLPVVLNAGVKEGVVVPDSGMEMFSIAQFEPAVILADIRHFATITSEANLLEVTVLRSRLSAFYSAKGCLLPIYHEPLGIEGLMDEDSVPRETVDQGPVDGDLFIGPEGCVLTHNGSETPLDGSHRRKQKSIAELLENTEVVAAVNNIGETEGEELPSKLAVKSGRKKMRKPLEDQTVSLFDEANDDESRKNEDEGHSRKLAPKSGRKRQNLNDENQSHVVDNAMVTRSSTRKKEGLVRSTTCKKKISTDNADGSEVRDLQKLASVPRERKATVSLGIDSNLRNGEGYERMSPREKKKSKYLSPPFTSLQQRPRNANLLVGPEASGLEFSDVSKVGERMSKVASKLVGSPPLVKCSGETFQKSSKGVGSKRENVNMDSENQQCNWSSKVGGSTGNLGSSNSVLGGIRSAALDPLVQRKDQCFDTIRDFLSSYRSSSYKNGSNYNVYKKGVVGKQKRKRSSLGTNVESDVGELNEVDRSSGPKTRGRSVTKKEEKDVKGNHEVGSFSLVITFPAETFLPSKEDILKMHCNFGSLDKSRTEVIAESSTAKIVFSKRSDAEVAMGSMKKSAPFGTTRVMYKIQHLKSAKKANMQKQKRVKYSEAEEGSSSDKHPPEVLDNESLAVVFIKQKLETMMSMLANTDGKMSREIKSNLENEVKELMKKVKMMTASSSS